jgi:rSAM/selenodomain-associated transferase 1
MSGYTFLDPARHRVDANLCAFGIMTKAPEAGRVKTRLSPPLSSEQASELNKCFLADIGASIEKASSESSGAGVAVYTPLGKEKLFEGLLPASFKFVPQRGEGFGERLAFAGEDLLKLGFASFCLINSDSPTVQATSFTAAARALGEQGDRMVIGPSDDGGYYLIGLKKMHRRLFEEIDWSTEKVFEQTKQRADELKL